MPARLCVHLPDEPALIRVLDDGARMSLGRAPDCDLVLDHSSVSRHHALLSHEGASWIVRDLSSKNGVRIGGTRVAEGRLRSGQWFSIGDVFCQFDEVVPAQLDALAARAAERRHNSHAWAARLQRARGTDELLAGLITAIVELAECRRGFLLAGNPVQGLRVRACYQVSPDELLSSKFEGSSTAIERTLRERRAIFLTNPQDQGWLKGRASVIAQGIRAIASVPLVHEGKLLGVAYADSDETGKAFTEIDAEILTAFAAQAAVALAAASVADALSHIESWLAVDAEGVRSVSGQAPTWDMLRAPQTS